MEHIAILKKSWKLTEKILSGKKKIESRWYMGKYAPWGRIHAGETVYFKDSGEPVSLKATVEKVLQFENLNPKKVKEILDEWGSEGGICVRDYGESLHSNKNKNYCMLIFLKNAQPVKSFEINKKGFGLMAAWICTDSIDRIKK